MASTTDTQFETIQHAGEDQSNEIRRRVAKIEPLTLRTYTPSQAVIAKSAGSYHWTLEGRKLADFSSGVLVANLGHNPTRWWQRVIDYMGLDSLKQAGEFVEAIPLTAYNAVTELDVVASERLVANLRGQPGGGRMEQVFWSASGSEAIQKSLWAALARRPGEDIMLARGSGFMEKKGSPARRRDRKKIQSAILACASSRSHPTNASTSSAVASRSIWRLTKPN